MVKFKYTNKYNVPDIFVKAIEKDEYDMQDSSKISVTSLIDSPKIWRLRTQSDATIELDVSDSIWKLFGTAMHTIIERGATDCISEKRLYLTVPGNDLFNGITGKFDLYNPITKELSDNKITSKYAVREGGRDEWHAQLNVLAYLIEVIWGLEVKTLKINAILRDWNPKDRFTDNMPDRNVMSIDIPKWTQETIIEYIRQRVVEFIHADEYECTEEDRWTKKDVYAIVKKDGDRSKKNFNNEREANEYLLTSPGYHIEYRKGEDSRCVAYCEVCTLCDYWKEHYQDKLL